MTDETVYPKQADSYVWKLRVTSAVLIIWSIASVASLWTLAQRVGASPQPQPWALSALVAALGGLVGGVARALYFFSFDSYAFNHKLRTGRSSVWAQSVCAKLDDMFDPLWVWYLWCLKPAVGAMVGLVLGLAIELGLLSLGGGDGTRVDINLRLLVVGGIAGLFSERLFERMQASIGGGRQHP